MALVIPEGRLNRLLRQVVGRCHLGLVPSDRMEMRDQRPYGDAGANNLRILQRRPARVDFDVPGDERIPLRVYYRSPRPGRTAGHAHLSSPRGTIRAAPAVSQIHDATWPPHLLTMIAEAGERTSAPPA